MNSTNKKLKISNSDTILDIVSLIEKEAIVSSSIYLEVEENDALKNFFNLKLLLFKFNSVKFHIITGDKDLKILWEKLWIKFFYKSDDIEFEENFWKKHILKYNFTFFEFLIYEIKKIFSRIVFFFKKRTLKSRNKKIIEDSNFFLLIFWLIISLSLLSFIFYFAVSKTYVYISPELGIKTVSRNIIFSENWKDNIFDTKNIVQVKNVSVSASLDYTFNVSTIDASSAKNAYWTIDIINELPIEQIFKPNTRFVTENWLVYRSSEWIKVPWSWKAEASVIADMYDLKWNLTGKRWNISSGLTLTIPWLKFNRDKIYAKSNKDFVWWIDPKIHILTQEEFEKFSWIIKEKLKTKASDALKEKIRNSNVQSWENYEILPVNDIIKYEIWEIFTLNNAKIWDKIDEVTLKWSINVKTYAYNKSELVSYLKAILNDSILLWTEKLINVNEDSIKVIWILSQTDNPFYMKATTELDSTTSYNFEDSSNTLTKKLKNLIVSSTKKDATSILLNDPNIANVKIDFSPFWLTRVSNNPDNIDFIIEK
ncbi:MAG: hypothetical protein ACD_4C00350G0001 [uncultured bacterium (gcode 4)]|uniref:Baseplate protein J-like domain-containing protein n=1 Tax=uncultured bacterium (gcode 4) TaxID=1234023 RepID=K2GSI1_9BACT|nr:MAG: hypothetical protein ACD_4C00350G0001 [uncultured bacterium (gcode 4)]